MDLSRNIASRFASIALNHVLQEFPNKLDHVLSGPGDALTPRALHPIFFGSYDWHSCVHGYWTLARLLRRYPDLNQAAAITALFRSQFTAGNVAGECAYFERPESRGFERPYGWAWLLTLAAELQAFRSETWGRTLRPLADLIAGRLRAFLPLAHYPVRAGTHGNTAFALVLASNYAGSTGDLALDEQLRRIASTWYGGDRDCQAWEPSGDDFLSPALVEAECMRRLLPRAEFLPWLDGFLPRLSCGEPSALFRPVVSPDRSDGKLAHLDGLNLSRAWCWRSLSSAVPATDSRQPLMRAAAVAHLAAGLPFIAGHYMGEHWLASFALLALDVDGPDDERPESTEGQATAI